MTLNFLTIAGTDNVYSPSVIPDTTGIGKSNIFDSLSGGGAIAPVEGAGSGAATADTTAITDMTATTDTTGTTK